MQAVLLIGFNGCEVITGMEDPNENLPNITGYPVVGINQSTFFNNSRSIDEPAQGEDFYEQNAHYPGNAPSYTDNGDGTVTDNVIGLMWQQSFYHNGDGTVDYDDKLTLDEILAIQDSVNTGGYTDWRIPSIKEMYSLILFSGRDISGYEGSTTEDLIPFINREVFEYAYAENSPYTFIYSDARFDAAIDELKQHVQSRANAIRSYLE